MKIAQRETAIGAVHLHRAAGYSHAQRERIVSFIERMGGDWSIGELAAAMDMEKSTISARLNECLYETHQLVEMPKRKDRRSGITIRPVGLPGRQAELFS